VVGVSIRAAAANPELALRCNGAGPDAALADAATAIVSSPMHTIYLDPSVAADPDHDERLAHLVEAGHRLVLVAAKDDPTAPGSGPWTDHRTSIPTQPPRGSWYLTADAARCGDRVVGLRTVLIGPRESGQRPTRCDSMARDLREAVLEILAADAMPQPADAG
jgi:hypothetical protein